MWRAWAVISSIVVGVLVASLLGGTPSGAGYILGGAGVAAIVVVIVTAIREQHRIRRGKPPAAGRAHLRARGARPGNGARNPANRSKRRCVLARGRRLHFSMARDRMDTWTNLIAYRARGHVAHDPGLDLAFDVLVETATSFLEA